MAKVIVRGDLDLQKNKILNGGFEVVTALPETDYFEGRQVYNSKDKKLYICRNNGTSTATNYKWEIVGSNIKTIAKEGVPTTEDMSANDIAYNEIFIWQDTENEKSYLYQNVSSGPRKCGNEDEIQADLTAVETAVTALQGTVATNTTSIATNTANIKTNTDNISAHTTTIGEHTTTLSEHTTAINKNANDISAHTTAINKNADDITINKAAIKTNTDNITKNTTNIATNTAHITDLQNNRFKVFSEIEVVWSTTEDNEYMCSKNFSEIDANLHTVAGVTALIGNEEQILYTKIDNTNKIITITSNIQKNNVELIVYGWVSKETE